MQLRSALYIQKFAEVEGEPLAAEIHEEGAEDPAIWNMCVLAGGLLPLVLELLHCVLCRSTAKSLHFPGSREPTGTSDCRHLIEY